MHQKLRAEANGTMKKKKPEKSNQNNKERIQIMNQD